MKHLIHRVLEFFPTILNVERWGKSYRYQIAHLNEEIRGLREEIRMLNEEIAQQRRENIKIYDELQSLVCFNRVCLHRVNFLSHTNFDNNGDSKNNKNPRI